MSEHPKIAQALAAVMGDVQAVHKGGRNESQNYSFRGIDAVVNAVGPALRKHGVVCVPVVEDVTYNVVEVGQRRTPMRECTVKVRYVFHGPAGDSIECVSIGEAMDSGDKSTPKAMSVAYRVALLQALCIPTDEPDVDSQSYERSSRETAIDPEMQNLVDGYLDEIRRAKTAEDIATVGKSVLAAKEKGDLSSVAYDRVARAAAARLSELQPKEPS